MDVKGKICTESPEINILLSGDFGEKKMIGSGVLEKLYNSFSLSKVNKI